MKEWCSSTLQPLKGAWELSSRLAQKGRLFYWIRFRWKAQQWQVQNRISLSNLDSPWPLLWTAEKWWESLTFWWWGNNRKIHGNHDKLQGDDQPSSLTTVVRNDETNPRGENKHGGGKVKLEQERCLVASQPDVDSSDRIVHEWTITIRNHDDISLRIKIFKPCLDRDVWSKFSN